MAKLGKETTGLGSRLPNLAIREEDHMDLLGKRFVAAFFELA